MRLLIAFFILLLQSSILFAQSQKHARAKIFLEGRPLVELAALGLDIEHSHPNEDGSITSDFSSLELDQVSAAGFRYEVLIADVTRHYVEQNNPENAEVNFRSGHCNEVSFTIPENFELGSMGGFFTYEEMLENLDNMALKYPSIITSRAPADANIKTHENRDLFWLRISDNASTDEEEPEILYNSLIHAREPASLSQMIYYMWYLLENYGTDPEVTYLVDHTEMYFMPCINPDGYIYNQTSNPNGGGYWRKNKRDNNNDGVFDDPGDGVDLNRNFSFHWGLNDTGSSSNPRSQTYRGTSAFSEPETQILRNFCLAHDFQLVLNYHAFANVVIYPFSNIEETADPRFFAMGEVMTRHNHYHLGTSIESIGYRTNGDAIDWMYGDSITKPAMYGYIPEVGSPAQGFWPPSADIISLAQLNLYQNLHAAHLLLHYGEVIPKTPSTVSQKAGYLPYHLTRYGLGDGSFTVRLEGLSDNVITVGMTNTHDIPQLAVHYDSIDYQLDSAIEEGDSIRFRLSLSNGRFTWSDTLQFCYSESPAIFTDAANELDLWTDQGLFSDWGLSYKEYHSAPSSITNPAGNRPNPASHSLELVDPVSLEGVESAQLHFWAKWEIRDRLAYGQVSVSTDLGSTFTPVCGKYTTVEESGSIITNQPIYEGLQSEWVKEEIDLSDYIGEEVIIRFDFRPSFGNRDTIYLDDFELVTKGEGPVSVQPLMMQASPLFRFQPHPASEYTRAVFHTPLAEPAVLRFSDLSGRLLSKHSLSPGQKTEELNTAEWPSGFYHYQLLNASGQLLHSGKLIVTH